MGCAGSPQVCNGRGNSMIEFILAFIAWLVVVLLISRMICASMAAITTRSKPLIPFVRRWTSMNCARTPGRTSGQIQPMERK